jgi:hypothetical protein
MGDLTPLQVSAIFAIQKIINDEKRKATSSSSTGRKKMTIEEYRDRKSGKTLYTEQVTDEQKNNWMKMKEQFQKNPPRY